MMSTETTVMQLTAEDWLDSRTASWPFVEWPTDFLSVTHYFVNIMILDDDSSVLNGDGDYAVSLPLTSAFGNWPGRVSLKGGLTALSPAAVVVSIHDVRSC